MMVGLPFIPDKSLRLLLLGWCRTHHDLHEIVILQYLFSQSLHIGSSHRTERIFVIGDIIQSEQLVIQQIGYPAAILFQRVFPLLGKELACLFDFLDRKSVV